MEILAFPAGAVFVLFMFVVVTTAFTAACVASIRSGKFQWRGSPAPIEREKNPIAFWLSLAPFLVFIVIFFCVIVTMVREIWRGASR